MDPANSRDAAARPPNVAADLSERQARGGSPAGLAATPPSASSSAIVQVSETHSPASYRQPAGAAVQTGSTTAPSAAGSPGSNSSSSTGAVVPTSVFGLARHQLPEIKQDRPGAPLVRQERPPATTPAPPSSSSSPSSKPAQQQETPPRVRCSFVASRSCNHRKLLAFLSSV